MDPVVSVQTKLLRKRRRACKSSWSRIGSLKSFTLTIPWNLARPVKIFPGIIVGQRHTDQKQMGLPKEQCTDGQVIPFGAMVEYHSISAKDQSGLHQFGAKVLPSIFLGYELYAGESGKETLWSETLKN